ncbi:MAG: hypothetical protein V4699_00375 [Patescibacteria group bacterium]
MSRKQYEESEDEVKEWRVARRGNDPDLRAVVELVRILGKGGTIPR